MKQIHADPQCIGKFSKTTTLTKKSVCRGLFIFSLIIIFLCPCGLQVGVAEPAEQTLERGFAWPLEVDEFDVHKNSSDTLFGVMQHFLGTLITLDSDGNPQPGMAESWVFEDDYETLTFHLRKGLTWSDGVPITSETVKASLIRALSKESFSDAKSLLNFIRGGNTVDKEKGTELVSLQTPDIYTIKIGLLSPNPFYLKIFSHPFSAPIPIHQLDSNGEFPAGTTLASSGPYKLLPSKNKQTVNLVYNDGFYGDKPDYTVVNFYFDEYKSLIGPYMENKLDLLEFVDVNQRDWLRQNYPNELRIDDANWGFFLIFDPQRDTEREKEIRQIMLSIIEPDVLNKLIGYNLGIEDLGLIPWHREQDHILNAELNHSSTILEAKEKIKALGYDEDNPLSICISYLDLKANTKLVNYLTSMWRGLSIEASGRVMNPDLGQRMKDKLSQKHCFGTIVSFGSRFKHEEEIIDLFFTKGVFDSYQPKDTKINFLMKKIDTTYDTVKRLEYVRMLETELIKNSSAKLLGTGKKIVLRKRSLLNYDNASKHTFIAMSQLFKVAQDTN